MRSFAVRYLARPLNDDLTMIECLSAGSKRRLQDNSSTKWKETKVAIMKHVK